MSTLTSDYIAIDTNVFEHLMNPEKNKNGHIHKLLGTLTKRKIRLLIDNKRKILGEYNNKIPRYFKKANEAKNERFLLDYFIKNLQQHEKISVNLEDNLMTAIKKIVPENKGADRYFVYVAFKKGRVLVTNDRADFIDEGNQTEEKKRKLLKIQKKYFKKHKKQYQEDYENQADILTSAEAWQQAETTNSKRRPTNEKNNYIE